jgi:hypothetical protein
MGAQDSRNQVTALGVARENHQQISASAQIFDVMSQIGVFLSRSSQTNHRSLELGEKPMFATSRVQAMQTLVSVQDLNRLALDTRLEERLNGFAGMASIGDGANDTTRRIADEITGIVKTGVHGFLPT